MRTIPKRLQNSYFQLFKSRLIAKKQYDNEAIKHFETLLNASLPTTDYENTIYYFIKELYYDNRDAFLTYISNSNKQAFILYTNNKNIIEHFNLQYKIYINWDKTNKKYIVEKYNKSLDMIKRQGSLNSISSNSNQSNNSNYSNNIKNNLLISSESSNSLNSSEELDHYHYF